MGWRSKLLFLLIVYFAGFATAIYHLAPSGGKDYQTDNYSYSGSSGSKSEDSGGSVFGRLYDKAYSKASASFSGMDSKDLKESFNRCMQKLIEMAKSGHSTATAEGSEDK